MTPYPTSDPLYGLLGQTLIHALSPAMHNAALKEINAPGAYHAFAIAPDELPDFMQQIRTLPIRGLNVTIPYKETVIPYLDSLAPEAAAIGAVNAIYNDGTHLIGYNFDAFGFQKSLPLLPRSCQKAVVLGAGGAARSVIYELYKTEIEVIDILCRNQSQGHKLIASLIPPANKTVKISSLDESNWIFTSQSAQLIINTTPIGMAPNIEFCPVQNFAQLLPETIVIDLIYRPRRTLFLQKAGLHVNQTINGLTMLLGQGAKSFALFTGQEPPLRVMQQTLENELNEIIS